ncbi:MAG: aminopeptidase, partial [Caldilineales bacterium]
MNDNLLAQQQAYAELIIGAGVNLQPGQALVVRAELGHREFVRLLAEAAYAAGARHMEVMWVDPLTSRTRLKQVAADYLGWLPDYEVARGEEILADNWARISLTGSEYPEAMEDVEPAVLRTYRQGVQKKLSFLTQATMNNQIAWCVAAVPVKPWAQKVFPDLDSDTALERLWELVLRVCRADQPDPQAAWRQHDANLKKVSAFLLDNEVQALHFRDERLAADGKPSTDLRVGLTDRPNWPTGSSLNAAGTAFLANIPTEEIFSTPHNQRTEGWVRTSKPGFPFQREISGAYFRFEQGEVVEWRAEKGQEVLDELFQIPGARRLGEVA